MNESLDHRHNSNQESLRIGLKKYSAICAFAVQKKSKTVMAYFWQRSALNGCFIRSVCTRAVKKLKSNHMILNHPQFGTAPAVSSSIQYARAQEGINARGESPALAE
jgi:hypothetical protein